MKRVCLAKDQEPASGLFRYWCGRLCPREEVPNTSGFATTCGECSVSIRKATAPKGVVDLKTEL